MIRLPKGLWKFAYWPIAWTPVFLPAAVMGDVGSMDGALGLSLKVLGTAVVIWALMIHTVAGRTLKRLGHSRGQGGIWPDRLVTVGIYSCMRHPQHLGLALIPLGLGLALLLASPLALGLSGWGVLTAFLFVLAIEEPECLEKFGTAYHEYMKRTSAFSLSPRCIAVGLNELKKAKGARGGGGKPGNAEQ